MEEGREREIWKKGERGVEKVFGRRINIELVT